MNTDELDDDRLDAELRAAFAPPPASVLAERARAATLPVRVTPTRRSPWWFVVAAAAAILAAVFLFADRPPRGPEGHDGHELGRMWAVAYEHALHHGFEGTSCCSPDVDLGKACEERFATRLGLGAASEVQLLGCYCGSEPTGGCMALLARSNGEPIAVYVLPCEHDPRPELPSDSPLHLARREMGRVVLYALSKTPVPRALDDFVAP